MFTGIIKNIGTIQKITETDLAVATDNNFTKNLEKGASVAINGTCLTVTDFGPHSFSVQVMPETIARTNLSQAKPGDEVNLEMPATPNSFLAGHIVQGHIDGTAKLESIADEGNSRILDFSAPEALAKYIVEKGSVAVNGVSLTVISRGGERFTVGIIPHTWATTMFHNFKVGDLVNIEVDVLAKYIDKLFKK